jgi:hypothetical protein
VTWAPVEREVAADARRSGPSDQESSGAKQRPHQGERFAVPRAVIWRNCSMNGRQGIIWLSSRQLLLLRVVNLAVFSAEAIAFLDALGHLEENTDGTRDWLFPCRWVPYRARRLLGGHACSAVHLLAGEGSGTEFSSAWRQHLPADHDQLTLNLHQRPPSTSVQLVHTEGITFKTVGYQERAAVAVTMVSTVAIGTVTAMSQVS